MFRVSMSGQAMAKRVVIAIAVKACPEIHLGRVSMSSEEYSDPNGNHEHPRDLCDPELNI